MSPRTPPTDYPSTTATLYSAAIARNEQGPVQQRLLLAAIVEEAQDAVMLNTLDGIVTTWNHAAERLLGYSAGEVIGMSNSAFVPADYLHEHEVLVESVCQGQVPAPFDTMRRHKTGDLLPVTLTLSPVKNALGEIVGVSTIARNREERRWSRESLSHEDLDHEARPTAPEDRESSLKSLSPADRPTRPTNHGDDPLHSASVTAASEALQQSLRASYDATVECWSRILDLRDKETEGHNRRVTALMIRLAKHVGMNDEEVLFAKWGAQLHDIGKIAIPDEILHKSGPLSVEEWIEIRRHPGVAYEMLAPITFLGPAIDVAYCHHEKWDGTGYPRGLRGAAIPFAARLFAVIDVYDALCSDRSYRDGWPEHQVCEHLRRQAGSHFDPQAVDALLAVLEEDRALSADAQCAQFA